MDMLGAVKEKLTKEVDVKEFLEMEIELSKLKELLATEVKLKEFLVQEIDLKKLLSVKDARNKKFSTSGSTDAQHSAEAKEMTEVASKSSVIKKDLPAFDSTLTNSLHEENKKIRFMFNQLMRFAIEKDYVKAGGRLEQFNTTIREHYRRADTELYAYLKTAVQLKYPRREKAFTQLSLEMKNISIEIFFTISQSPNLPLTEQSYHEFMKEFIHLGKLMNDRIHREESVLFKMYDQTNLVKSIS